ncbi:MAG TPA: hypothetical protein PKE03_07655 [Bacteroidales bacterium]|nr:hypothetical protein [Bacteroidales bacterium]
MSKSRVLNALQRADVSFYVMLGTMTVLGAMLLSHFPSILLSWDIFGYYLYLPFTFIYHDLGLENFAVVEGIIAKYQNTVGFYQALPMPDGRWVMKYPMGMAVLYSPWFFIGHLWAYVSGYEMDGFSFPYQASLLYGSFIYTLAGLALFRKAMLHFFPPCITALLLVLIPFGTNFMIHTVWHGQGLMSHNYLFFLFAAVLWLTIRWHQKPTMRTAAMLGLTIGLSALSRPTEILVAIVPLLWGVYDRNSLMAKWKLVLHNWKMIGVAILTTIAVGSLQLIYFKWLTGKFLFYSYGGNAGEGMEFFQPYIMEVLFSFRKGWLLYTPLMALAIIGFINLWKQKREVFLAVFVLFLLSFYVIASWSCWWYADSFSQRAVIPGYVMLSIPMGYLLQSVLKSSWMVKVPFFVLLLLLLAFNQFQSWQFLQGHIHSARMTREAYRAVFLKTAPPADLEKLWLVDRTKSPEQLLESGRRFRVCTLAHYTFDDQPAVASMPPAGADSGFFVLSPQQPFSPVYETDWQRLSLHEFGIIRVSARVYANASPAIQPFYLTATFMHNGYAYAYKSRLPDPESFEIGAWNEVELYYLTPEVRKPTDPFRATIWLPGEGEVLLDDFKVELFLPDGWKE